MALACSKFRYDAFYRAINKNADQTDHTKADLCLSCSHLSKSALWDSVIVLCFVVRFFMSLLVLQSS